MIARWMAATALTVACIAPASAAQQSASPAPVTHEGAALIVRQPDATSSLVGVCVVIPAGLDRQGVAQDGIAALTAETLERSHAPGSPAALGDAIAAAGGSIDYTVDAHDVRFYVEATAAQAPAVLALFTSTLAHAAFDAHAVDEARANLLEKIDDNEHTPLVVGVEMLQRARYLDSTAGFPQFGSPLGLSRLSVADVDAFFASAYRRDGAIVSAAGALDTVPPGTVEAIAAALPAGAARAPQKIAAATVPALTHQYVAHRDVNAPWLVAQFQAPAIGTKDFGAMLVLTAEIQRALGFAAQIPDLVENWIGDQAVGSMYDYSDAAPTLDVFVDGGIGDPSTTFAAALSMLDRLGSGDLQAPVESVKSAAAGRFTLDAMTLKRRTWLAAIFAARTNSADFLKQTDDAIDAVSAADVQRVARAYLKPPAVAIVLPRSDAAGPN